MALALAGPLGPASLVFAGESWPQFRGPTGLGLCDEEDLPLRWGGESGENVLWKAPLTGEGHSSPIVSNGQVITCTAFWPPEVKDREKVIPEHHVASYRTGDGRRLWDTRVPPGPWLRTDFRSGPGGGYAAPTPATDGERIVCAFGSSVLAALDFEGRILWRKEIVPYSFDVTLGTSPVMYRDTVILFCAMARPEDSRVAAFETTTGRTRWERRLPTTGFGHSTPILIQVEGKTQLVVLASAMKTAPGAIRALDPEVGKPLWWAEGAGDAASPAFGGGLLYFDSGRGGPGFAFEPGGEGDITATRRRWTVSQVPEGIGSPIIVGEHVYRLHAPAILRCLSLRTGKEVYAQRLAGLDTTWASPIADPQGRIYFASAGTSVVVQAGPEFRLLATNSLGDPNHASPAAAGGRLYLAGKKSLHAIGKR